MNKVICFDTSIATSNMGDYIIAESCNRQLSPILDRSFVLRFPTHTPVSHWYQDFSRTSGGRYNGQAQYKFAYGTNLLHANMMTPTPNLNANLFNCKMLKGLICVGVGLGSSNQQPNWYTQKLLRKILSHDYAHSTRDEKTAEFLRGIGLKAINTGCATTWDLTNAHCAQIPQIKSDSVVFTLTDYKRDSEADLFLIETLKECYKTVYFWVQGIEDYSYITSLTSLDGIHIVHPSLEAYTEILQNNDIDYVGTRLHAGIKALQCKRRSIIIEVDNRASDMKACIDLPTLKRSELHQKLKDEIFTEFLTELDIDTASVEKWKSQFEEFSMKTL